MDGHSKNVKQAEQKINMEKSKQLMGQEQFEDKLETE